MGDPDLPRTPSAVLDRLPLSFNQEFLCMLDKGDEEGAFGPRHTVVFGWRVFVTPHRVIELASLDLAQWRTPPCSIRSG